MWTDRRTEKRRDVQTEGGKERHDEFHSHFSKFCEHS